MSLHRVFADPPRVGDDDDGDGARTRDDYDGGGDGQPDSHHAQGLNIVIGDPTIKNTHQ